MKPEDKVNPASPGAPRNAWPDQNRDLEMAGEVANHNEQFAFMARRIHVLEEVRKAAQEVVRNYSHSPRSFMRLREALEKAALPTQPEKP